MSAHASPALCEFVRKQAPPHYATPDAPSTWPALQAWRNEWSDKVFASGAVFIPVFDGGCDDTIYPDPRTNHAFRAWHDSIHLANSYSFSREHEIKVGLIHMQQARAAGLSKLDQDMLIADTIGQIEYYVDRGDYVKNQAVFVAAVLEFGLKSVIDSGDTY